MSVYTSLARCLSGPTSATQRANGTRTREATAAMRQGHRFPQSCDRTRWERLQPRQDATPNYLPSLRDYAAETAAYVNKRRIFASRA